MELLKRNLRLRCLFELKLFWTHGIECYVVQKVLVFKLISSIFRQILWIELIGEFA